MLDFLVAVLLFSYYVTLFAFVPLSMALRAFIVFQNKKPLKVQLLVLFDITSVSYFFFLARDDKYYKWYNILLYIFSVFAFFAFAFGIHMFF